MSIETRRQNIIETNIQYNTCIELNQETIDYVAAGGATPSGYSEHQKQAARLAAKSSIYEARIILEWCAVLRPPLFMGVVEAANILPYEGWQEQHSQTVADLAKDWAQECSRARGAIERVYDEYVELEAL